MENSKAKKKSKLSRTKLLQSLFIIGIAIAIGILVFPSFMDSLNDAHQIATIGGYEETLANITESERAAMREAAEKYNEKIFRQQQKEEFIYQGEEYDDPEYDSILAPLENSLVMAYIEIPRIKVYLPVTHGTRTEDLEYQVGHMRGTSVPIGGESTHAVIAAHTGLQNADLFTDVVDLELGDVFYIHVLHEIHVYTVDQIKVVWPGEEVPFIQVEEGKDYITLFTCTPYGINDHRLLVRGERTYPDLAYSAQNGGTGSVTYKNLLAWLLTIALGLLPIAILVLGLLFVNKKKKKTKHNSDIWKQLYQEAYPETDETIKLPDDFGIQLFNEAFPEDKPEDTST